MAIANQAMDEDKAGSAEAAYRLYESAIEHLMCAIKCTGAPARPALTLQTKRTKR